MNPLERAWVLLKEEYDEYGEPYPPSSDEEVMQARARMKELEEEWQRLFNSMHGENSQLSDFEAVMANMDLTKVSDEMDTLRPIINSRPPTDLTHLNPIPQPNVQHESGMNIDLGSAGIEDAKEQHKQRMREEKRKRRGE